MAALTPAQRIKRQRELRLAQGWIEVRVWVPTEEDAVAVRKVAEEARKKATGLRGIFEEKLAVKASTIERTLEAVAEQGSAAYTTPSGAVLTLLSELAEEGDVEGLATAYGYFARAKPRNAAYVAEQVPAKIINWYFCHRMGLNGALVLNWTSDHPEWATQIKEALGDSVEFGRLVRGMASAIAVTGRRRI
jgi:hypothetical protein